MQMDTSLARKLAVVLALVALVFSGCAGSREDEWEHPVSDQSPYYDARYFAYEDGRYSFRSGDTVGRTGVDVSEYQGLVDWNAAAADGVSFAFVRIGYRGSTEGGLFADERFEENLQGAREAGVERGVYFFSQATSVAEAQEEAAFVLSLLDYRELEYPVVFDYEFVDGTRVSHVDSETATDCAVAFCEAIRDGGYTPMVYGNAYDLDRLYLSELSDYDFWLAEYGGLPEYTESYVIWQYTSEGAVAGIGSGVDLNLDLGYRTS